MLQTGYVDSQLVRFLDLIRDTSWYDDALVMVMADHGIAFRAGALIRGGIEGDIDDVAYVPLFMKAPGQSEGRIDDRPAMLYDVMPTIADVLEVESPWQMEGVSLLDDDPDNSRQRVFEGVVANIDVPSNPVFDDAIARKVELFGSGTGWDTVYNFGPYRDLVGQSADSLTQEQNRPKSKSSTRPSTTKSTPPPESSQPSYGPQWTPPQSPTTHGWPSQSTEPSRQRRAFMTGLRGGKVQRDRAPDLVRHWNERDRVLPH